MVSQWRKLHNVECYDSYFARYYYSKKRPLEDGMDETLVLQIRKRGVHFQYVCSAVVLISFLCILTTIGCAEQI